ncbi:SMP-30/gluconolactonase/LRE family protein [Kitasatospora sp. NBC_01250]|uniref:SMP-30/gluconolactonase/LRE family protein n=1 Tax=unclassified Kitasatospora TaxID=2633591 RepID=UPI002E102C1B|nr:MULTISPECIES: SMP-30/gluconolactonase/LRE family protein [unclassified Kitasatospora]WSJ65343.1 SMP-30/gluconolactonase/LRE family protein [Kitasatospora sp. NBC_01302]
MHRSPVTHRAVPVVRTRAEVGESPLWDSRAGVLWWTDIPRGRLHRFAPATGADPGAGIDSDIDSGADSGTDTVPRPDLPGPLSAVALHAGGGLLAALGDQVLHLTDDGRTAPVARVPLPSPEHRLNDGRVDPLGRFWVGTMSTTGERGTSALHRVDPDGRSTLQLAGVSISNGLDHSPDGRLAYYADTPTGEVAVLDCADPHRPPRRVGTLARFTHGVPDGLAVDAEGCVWVALFNGWAVHRYRPDGTLDAVVPLPVAKVTSCAFGGPGLDTLYITTASRLLDATELAGQPLAGSLFACRPGVTGLPAHAFAGRGLPGMECCAV